MYATDALKVVNNLGFENTVSPHKGVRYVNNKVYK